MSADFNPVIVIPHYNHADTLINVVERLRSFNLPIIIVDDGSDSACFAILKRLAEQEGVSLHDGVINGGKGRAVKIGLKLAWRSGFTHAVQIDADGQHDLADVPIMLAQAKQFPHACICGRPIYSQDAPKARLYGRKITDFWNMVHTLSTDIADGMCGFRLYPLAKTVSLCERTHIGDRMDFDTELLIKMHWEQIPLIWINTAVKYHPDGVSHFRAIADNWAISKMHTRLFFGMLIRLLSGRKV